MFNHIDSTFGAYMPSSFSSEILPPSLRQMWSKCLVTSLPQTELCLSLFGCACLCYAVPVRIGLCLSLLRCAYLYWAVPVFVRLCLSLLGCACLCYAVPNRVQLCWPLRVPLLFRNRILILIPLYKILSAQMVGARRATIPYEARRAESKKRDKG